MMKEWSFIQIPAWHISLASPYSYFRDASSDSSNWRLRTSDATIISIHLPCQATAALVPKEVFMRQML